MKWPLRKKGELQDTKFLLERLQEHNARLVSLLGFREQLQHDPPTESQIHAAFQVVDASTPLWRATHALLDAHTRDAFTALLPPGLSNEDAQFNRGYAAALHDFKGSLLQTWMATQQESK